MSHFRPLLLTLLGALAIPGAARADAPWTAPQPVPQANSNVPMAVVTDTGAALVLYTPNANQTDAAAIDAAGAAGSPQPQAHFAATFAKTAGADRIVLAGARNASSTHPIPVIATTKPGADAGTGTRLLPSGWSGRVAGLATDAKGDAAVALIGCDTVTCKRLHPYVVRVSHTGKVSAPEALTTTSQTIFATVAIDSKGRLVAVYERPLKGTTGTRGIYVRRTTSAAGRFGTEQQLGSDSPEITPVAALDDSGRAIVAWLSQRVSEGDAGTAVTRIAIARPGHSFGKARTLGTSAAVGTGRNIAMPGVVLNVTPDGSHAQVTWTAAANNVFGTYSAPITGNAIGTAQLLSPAGADAVLTDAAMAPSGALTVLSRGGIGGGDPRGPLSLLGSLAPAGGAFAAAETVRPPSAGPTDGYIGQTALAIDPTSGRSIAAWNGLSAGVLVSTRP